MKAVQESTADQSSKPAIHLFSRLQIVVKVLRVSFFFADIFSKERIGKFSGKRISHTKHMAVSEFPNEPWLLSPLSWGWGTCGGTHDSS